MNGDWRVTGFHEVRELGRGAHGRVVLARPAGSDAPVAIKYLTRGDDPEHLRRMRGEAVLLGRVADPHVAELYRFVEGEHGAAIVMEAVNGVSLKAILERHGGLPPEDALVVLKGSLLGLAAAHAVGVVHRDYKPANVVVQADGLSKLVDFGVATMAGRGAGAGTPAYMAPEQWEGGPATPATDVYAATCVFFECVTGRRPFTGETKEELARRHLLEPIPLEDVPEPLRPLVAAGMAKSAEQRPPGARPFLTELERIAEEAYGRDWQDKGVRGLAVTAAALAPLLPLGAVAAAGAQGAAVAVAQGGLMATTGAKVAAAVTATAAVAAAAGGVYAVRDEEPRRPQAVQLAVAAHPAALRDRAFAIGGAQYAQVSGMTDAALQARVNRALRTPLDDTVVLMRQLTTGCEVDPQARVQSGVQTGLRGPVLVSVAYRLKVDRNCAGSTDLVRAVTVDLRTGRVVEPRDLWKPPVLTASWLSALNRRAADKRWLPPATCQDAPELDAAHLVPRTTPGEPPPFSHLLTADGIEFYQSVLGTECNNLAATLPYRSVRDLIRPQLAAVLPGRP
ncbi:serine/threonine-protein kinase [Thermomonospora umbrina]|nr:serine/threonine-protein kinase [Thermomonospora umbrina]